MTRYRLYTENTDRQAIVARIARYFHGFTITDTIGYYKGRAERSLVIEILADSNYAHIVRFIAKVVCQEQHQECVLVASETTEGKFVSC